MHTIEANGHLIELPDECKFVPLSPKVAGDYHAIHYRSIEIVPHVHNRHGKGKPFRGLFEIQLEGNTYFHRSIQKAMATVDRYFRNLQIRL